eukprot:3806318-Lingulodinium_polyedra.AAC.1
MDGLDGEGGTGGWDEQPALVESMGWTERAGRPDGRRKWTGRQMEWTQSMACVGWMDRAEWMVDGVD